MQVINVREKGLEVKETVVHACCVMNFNSLLVKGCDFQHDAPQIDLGSTLKKAIVIGNVFTVSKKNKYSNRF